MKVKAYDTRACSLGEGPLWHPIREQLFWFDINNAQLHSQNPHGSVVWNFGECVSAAGWIDQATLLIASEKGLLRFDINSGQSTHIADLEKDQPDTRSNDGRADPWGGFWIGTMGKNAQANAGAIYRYYRGELRELYGDITISNSICFSPDQKLAYFSDTPTQKIMQVALDPLDGWPTGNSQMFVDLSAEDLRPDGSVVDSEGCLWNAQYGAGRVARYSQQGKLLSVHNVPASQTTCPAFGGPDLTSLFVTSAAQNMDEPAGGQTFKIDVGTVGQREHRVIL